MKISDATIAEVATLQKQRDEEARKMKEEYDRTHRFKSRSEILDKIGELEDAQLIADGEMKTCLAYSKKALLWVLGISYDAY